MIVLYAPRCEESPIEVRGKKNEITMMKAKKRMKKMIKIKYNEIGW